MKADVLFIDGCPHHKVAIDRLREAAGHAGVNLEVTPRQVRSAEDAARWGFGGSPSIIVDGSDLFPTAPVGELAHPLCARDTTSSRRVAPPRRALVAQSRGWGTPVEYASMARRVSQRPPAGGTDA